MTRHEELTICIPGTDETEKAGSALADRVEAASVLLKAWYDELRPAPDREAPRYVVCVGLAVLHRMREGWPIERHQYISGLDVRTSGPLIRNILAEHGHHRLYASAGGRTSGPSVLIAQDLAGRMNALAADWHLTNRERNEIIDQLQRWLIAKVEIYFGAHPVSTPTKRMHCDQLRSAG